MKILPCAQALYDAMTAERMAEWKESGRVAEAAQRAAERATAAFIMARLAYHGRGH